MILKVHAKSVPLAPGVDLGVIARGTLVPCWNWIAQVLLPAETQAYIKETKAQVLTHRLDAAIACVGDLAGLSLDDAMFAATTGDVGTADRALEVAMAEGAAPVQVLRTALGHLQRLHRVRVAMDEQNLTPAEATKGARPPVFYRRTGAFIRSLTLWPSAQLMAALAAVSDAERNCISNVRPAGLCYDQAADKLVFLLKGAQALGRSGIDLKDDTPVANAIAAPTTAQLQK